MELRKLTLEFLYRLISDLNSYPALDVRFDRALGAKRIEWNFDDTKNTTWAAITDVNDPGLACKLIQNAFQNRKLTGITGGVNPRPPALHAKARAGSNITVQWSGVVRLHQGPILSVRYQGTLLMLAYSLNY